MGGIACVHRGAGAAAGRARRRADAADHRRRRRARAVGERTRAGLAPRPAAGRVEAGFRAGVVDRGRSRGPVWRQSFARQRADWRVAGRTGAAGGVNYRWPTTETVEVLKIIVTAAWQCGDVEVI